MKRLLILLVACSLWLAALPQTYHLVVDGEITLTGIPVTYSSIAGFYYKNYRTADDSIWYADGFRVDVTPDYDASAQYLGAWYYDIGNDNCTREVIDYTDEQLAAMEEAGLQAIDNQFDIAKIKYLLRLLAAPVLDTLELDSTSISALTNIYEQYRVNKAYAVGDVFVSDSTLYKVIQAHTSQSDWIPSETPALYNKYQIDTGEILEWDYPVEYSIDDQVTYNGDVYICIQAHTSQSGWTPVAVASLWELVE